MDSRWLAREKILIGDAALKLLENATVAVVGLGGVGGAAAEAVARAGVGHVVAIDYDIVDITNLNRQIMTTFNDVGKVKTDVVKARLLSINPEIKVTALDIKIDALTIDELFICKPDFIIDAIDMVSSKLLLIEEVKKKNIPIISSMGTGNRLSPLGFKIGTIAQTSGSGCKLARVMRLELKKRNIVDTPVVYSTAKVLDKKEDTTLIGSVSFVPPVAGYILASYAVNCLISKID